jgi:hypothetical protein
MKDVILKKVESNKEKGWVLTCSQGSFFRSLSLVECDNVTCTLISNKQKIATLNAKKSIINRKEQTIFLPGDVNGAFKGLHVKGQDVYYTLSSNKLWSNQPTWYNHTQFSNSPSSNEGDD